MNFSGITSQKANKSSRMIQFKKISTKEVKISRYGLSGAPVFFIDVKTNKKIYFGI